MGNSKLAQGCQLPARDTAGERQPDCENGFLSQVPGDLIARGLAALPPASTIGPDRHEVDIDAGPLGRVKLSVERKQVKHGRHSHYYWSAWRAEAVDSAQSDSE